MWLTNAGFAGYSTFGHAILVEDVLSQLRPKVVLFLVGANELGLMEISHFDRENLADTRSLMGVVKWGALRSEVVALGLNLGRA